MNPKTTETMKEVSQKELINDMERVAKSLDRAPLREEYTKLGKYTLWTIKKSFGTWGKAVEKVFGKKTNSPYKNVTAENIIADINAIQVKLGRTLFYREYKELGGKYAKGAIQYHFGSWGSLISKLNLPKCHVTTAIADEEILADIELTIEKNKGVVSFADYKRLNGKYGQGLISQRFGSWGVALLRLGHATKLNGTQSYVEQPRNLRIESFDAFPRINTDKALICFDMHVPYHDHAIINEMIHTAKQFEIDTLIVVGDFLDFKGLYKKEVQTTRIDWTEELEAACELLEQLAKHFKHIHITMGNHDFRLVRLLDSNDRADRLYRLIFGNTGVKFSKYQYALINDWLYVSHSGNSKTKLSKLERIVNVKRMSMLVGHSHRYCLGVHDSGIEILGEGLHLTKPEYHEYASLTLGDYSQWIQGFWMMMNNKIYPYVKHERVGNITDFENK